MEHHYRNRLSPFGCDVLDVMIRQWRRDRNADLNRRRDLKNPSVRKSPAFPFPRDFTRNERMLTFNNAEVPRPCVDYLRDDSSNNVDSYLAHARNVVSNLYNEGSGSDPEPDAISLQLIEQNPVINISKKVIHYRKPNKKNNNNNVTPDELDVEMSTNVTRCNEFKDKINIVKVTRHCDKQTNTTYTDETRHDEPNDKVTREPIFEYHINEIIHFDEHIDNSKVPHCDGANNNTINSKEIKRCARTDGKIINNKLTRCDEANNEINIGKVALDESNDKINIAELATKAPNKETKINNEDTNIKMNCHEIIGSDDSNDIIMTIDKVTRCDDPRDGTDEIKWNNMFDTEILSQANLLEDVTFQAIQAKEMQSKIINIPEVKMSIDTAKVSDTNLKGIQIISNEVIQPENFKKKTSNKRKAQTKITDAVPKKVKKIPSESKKSIEPSIRKQSYKKTVNNWLETLEPCDVVADKSTTDDSINEIKPIGESPPKIKRKVSESKDKPKVVKSPKEKKNKKVIQAQLANKDGVMKFKKPNPKHKKEDSEPTDNTTESPELKSTETKEGSTADKTKATTTKEKATPAKAKATIAKDIATTANEKATTAKDKKPKSKFVAPIKSQIPVRDITYEIVQVNQNNFVEHLNSILNEINVQEIAFVLLYRNGFCQLNSHYTNDTCVPEGVMLSMCDTSYYIKHAECSEATDIKELLLKILTSKTLICYDGKSILIYLASEFKLDLVDHELEIIDCQIAGSLLEPDDPPENFSALQKIASFSAEYRVVTECPQQRSAWHSRLLLDCCQLLRAALVDQELWDVFRDIEMAILPIIADMELCGVCVDLQQLQSMERCLLERMQSTEHACHRAAGHTFQVNSAVQVRGILYDELKLDARLNLKVQETVGTGAKSTSETMLRRLTELHPLPRLILEYRHLHKAHATFLIGIRQQVRDGLVRPTWVQTAAATGRIASSGPNLQAIPKAPFSLALFPDTEDKDSPTLNFRSVYVARAGHCLLAADFQHIECRVLAHLSADGALRTALRRGADLFRELAGTWMDKPSVSVTGADRERTKRVVYASLYGAGARKLAELLEVDLEQARAVLNTFNRSFPSLRAFGRSVVARCGAAGGRLATLCGRARRFKHIASADFTLRAHAERQAVNYIVQGSAADLCKLAMAACAARLREAEPRLRARLRLQIHDELVWELTTQDVPRAADIIRDAMESCGRRCGLTVGLPVAIAHGRTWGEMEPLH